MEKDSSFWIAAESNQTRALSASGNVTTAEPGQELSVLCTQSAPFANSTSTDTSEKWQVSVQSNNEELVGSVQARPIQYLVALPQLTFSSASVIGHRFASMGSVTRPSQNGSHIPCHMQGPTALSQPPASAPSALRARPAPRTACF